MDLAGTLAIAGERPTIQLRQFFLAAAEVRMAKKVCVVVGVGPGNGAALARRFSVEGYAVALLARSTGFSETLAAELGDAKAYACDVTDTGAIETVFSAIKAELGLVSVLVYNAGSGVFASVEETTPDDFEMAWRINALGALVACQQVISDMKAAGEGVILITGATASLRGGARFAAFASAKAAQRNLAQSMARHLGSAGIHVALVIVDGMIDIEGTRAMMPDKGDEFFLKPDDIAHTYYHLATQPKSAWSFEVDIRPSAESW